MSSNYSVKTDLKEAKAMAEGLAEYVRGDELFGHAGGGFFSNMPSLTVGALLMRLRRLESLRSSLNKSQLTDLEQTLTIWQTTREEWRSHYETKMLHEVESRIDSMRSFFRECADSQQSCYNNYRPEIQKRTIVEELLHEIDQLNVMDDELQEKVNSTDAKLRSYMSADDFQWSDELASVYPKDEYWWLYQKPPKPLDN